MTKFNNALRYLSDNDPVLNKVINKINPQVKKKTNDDFTSLVKIIISQQLSGTAARTIVNRLDKLLGNKNYNPKIIAQIANEELRMCGLSNAKASYLKGLTEILILNPKYFENLKKIEEINILKELCKIRGIGIWTASIFAMGPLGYKNIFPYGDVSLNKAIKILYNNEFDQEAIISKWSPYKSYACRVLWQWVDKGMPEV